MNSTTFTLLDLRLMLARRPLLSLFIGAIVLLLIGLVVQPQPVQPGELNGTSDPARVVAAQRHFQSMLIPAADLAKAQQAILDGAVSHQLAVGRVEYAQEADIGAGFARSTMNLPVRGRYADIRAFIESSLISQPAMSIRHLTIQRETSGEADFVLAATLTAQFLIGRH